MVRIKKGRAIASAVFGLLCTAGVRADVVAQWNFASASTGTVTASPAPSTGSGTASSLGMTNSYTYNNGEGPGAVDGSNMTSVKSAAFSSFTEHTWKIVGNSNSANSGPGMANGWNNAAPDYAQGAQFLVSTAGYTNVNIGFDWYSTTQGVANLQVRYTTDGGASWNNIGNDFVAKPNDFYGATASGVTSPNISIDLSGVSGVADNPNFGIQLVSVRPVAGDADYFATGPGHDGNYASASTTSTTPLDYNNQSGNWSFDNVTINGTATPEPASIGLLGAGAMLLSRRLRRQAGR